MIRCNTCGNQHYFTKRVVAELVILLDQDEETGYLDEYDDEYNVPNSHDYVIDCRECGSTDIDEDYWPDSEEEDEE